MSSDKRYSKTAIVLHWLIGFAILAMFAVGFYMHDLPKDAPKAIAYDLFDLGIYTWQLAEEVSPRTFYFNLHKSIGVTLLALILIRVYWRLTHQPPVFLGSIKAWEAKLATVVHNLMYVLMVVMPLSGVLMATYSKYGIVWFGLPLIPGLDNPGLRDFFKEAHEITGTLLLLLIILHIAGAIKHKIIDKDETMKRMTMRY